MKVTAEQLKAKGACKEQVCIFEKEWPDGVEITEEVLARATELHLDLLWFASNFLPAPAREAYWEATGPALEAYKKATGPAWKAYRKAIAPAREAYKKAIGSAREAYKKAIGSALWNIIKQEMTQPNAE